MKKIGLIGEDPNDTYALKNLLNQNFRKKMAFFPILKNIKGYQLDGRSFVNSLQIELSNTKYDLIIFIRDLDGLESEKRKVSKVITWFDKLNSITKGKGVLLLNIYEIEALIFADVETFNKIYKTSIKANRNVMYISEPKEELMRITNKLKKNYKERHCPELFSKLRYDIVKKNCTYFSTFVSKLEKD